MSDCSVTTSCILSFGKLLDRVERKLDPADVLELVNRNRQALAQPKRRVGAVLSPKPRGGRSPRRAGLLEQRDDAICELTELQPGKRRNTRIQEARQKLDRYAANGWPHERDKPEDTGNRERDLMRQIMRIGLPVPGERQHRKIVSARSQK